MSLAIAYFTPLPPQRSGIADYSAMLLPALAADARVTVFVDDERCLALEYPGVQSLLPIQQFRRREFDLAIYQMGNSLFHEKMYSYLRRYPGLTVLHDYYLHHFIASITSGRGDFGGYAREMGYARGHAGLRRARSIQAGQADHPLYDWPLNERILDCSLGVIVHSEYVAQRLNMQRPHLPVTVVPFVTQLPADQSAFSREELNLPRNAFIVGCAGLITPEKCLDLVLGAFAHLLQQVPHAHLLIVGEVPPWYPGDLPALIEQLGLCAAVTCTGYVASLSEFDRYLSTFDIGVNLRHPTSGETSAGALRMMAHGCPVIVSNAGWYAELPDETCLKIDHGQEETTILAHDLIELATDHTRRVAMGERARAYVAAQCKPEYAARAYIDFAQQIMKRACQFIGEERYTRKT